MRDDGKVVERTAVEERARRRRARTVDSWRVGIRNGSGGAGFAESVSWKGTVERREGRGA